MYCRVEIINHILLHINYAYKESKKNRILYLQCSNESKVRNLCRVKPLFLNRITLYNKITMKVLYLKVKDFVCE